MEGAKVTAGVRKSKKKQVKGEFDRIKQAEKKKRRLEKALANSAAIRTELEKKKQRKKEEEQERLEEEGAAIAEAVALHVLIEEDLVESCETVLKRDEGLSSWARSGSMAPHPNWSEYSVENLGLRVSDAYILGQHWNRWGNSNSMILSNDYSSRRDVYPRYLGRGGFGLSADRIAVECVSALDVDDMTWRDGCVFNHMLRG